MRSVRTVVRTLIAGLLAIAGPVLAAPAVQAHAQEVRQQSYGTERASSQQLTISIDKVNPSFATDTSTVTVSGTLTNLTGSSLQGLQVQLLSDQQWFVTRQDMASYAAGNSLTYIFPQAEPGATDTVNGTLRSGGTARWSASFSATDAGYSEFGVYPLEAQAQNADGVPVATERTYLPYWPGKGSAEPLDTAWVWPLVDQPQRDPCDQTLATDSLASSLATGGRLGTLLDVGEQWAQRDHLTWAVDPALLSDAQVMTHEYAVGGNAPCVGEPHKPASAAAVNWLTQLRTGTASEPMFLTPYANVDVAALSHAGLDEDLRTAYQLGESVARQILSRSFGINGVGAGDGGSPAVAWPANGTADASVLTSLASDGGISTVVLNSGELPSTDGQYDNALGSAATGSGTAMPVLLADSGLTGIIGSTPAGSSAAAQFSSEQDFLAQTAMISAEAPFYKTTRTLVIAPPQNWDPSAAEASALLSMTNSAPWLRKVPLSTLAAAAGRLRTHTSLPSYQVTSAELSSSYVDQVKSVDASLALYEDMLYQPSASLLRTLDEAAVATESSAWRGAGAGAGQTALNKLGAYLSYWEQKVEILAGTKPLLLAGSSGPAPVSVQNAGKLEVQVKVEAIPESNQLSVADIGTLITIMPGKTATVRMTVHSADIGTSTLQLQLVTENGSPLPWTTQSLNVQATRYGQALLVLIAAALGVLVLASVARWIRKRRGGGAVDDSADARSGGSG
jgi:Family of unknown function (DUF6049)